MNCNITKFSIGENIRIHITYENMLDELKFVGEYKTKINNTQGWHVFDEKIIKINELDQNKKSFRDILLEMRDNIIRKVELINTLKKSFENVDEIDVE